MRSPDDNMNKPRYLNDQQPKRQNKFESVDFSSENQNKLQSSENEDI